MSILSLYTSGAADKRESAGLLALGLMAGEPEKFKAGYSPDNALIAAIEMFDLSVEEATDVAMVIGATVDRVEGFVARYGGALGKES